MIYIWKIFFSFWCPTVIKWFNWIVTSITFCWLQLSKVLILLLILFIIIPWCFSCCYFACFRFVWWIWVLTNFSLLCSSILKPNLYRIGKLLKVKLYIKPVRLSLQGQFDLKAFLSHLNLDLVSLRRLASLIEFDNVWMKFWKSIHRSWLMRHKLWLSMNTWHVLFFFDQNL